MDFTPLTDLMGLTRRVSGLDRVLFRDLSFYSHCSDMNRIRINGHGMLTDKPESMEKLRQSIGFHTNSLTMIYFIMGPRASVSDLYAVGLCKSRETPK